MAKIVIDPVTRIEGHLKVEAITENGKVQEARCSGLLYRGLERILKGRDPRDAQRITQRICGVCPTAHATASSLALDNAFGITEQIPNNGRVMRNLVFGSNYIQSHLLHFYHLAALDFVDVTAAAGYAGPDKRLQKVADFAAKGNLAPFTPRYEGDYRLDKETNQVAVSHYVEALDKRREAQEMLAIFGGKMPHSMSIFPGGTVEQVTVDKIAAFRWRLERLRHFIDNIYLADVLAVAKAYPDYFGIGRGSQQYLCYGGFDQDNNPDVTKRQRLLPSGVLDGTTMKLADLDPEKITEQIKHSWYNSRSNLHPSSGETEADPTKPGGYSFIKAPRYDGRVYEVGPLARVLVAYVNGDKKIKPLVDKVLGELNAGPEALQSTMGRHAARAIEAKVVADTMAEWLMELKPGKPTCAKYDLPQQGSGMGLTEAPRGALGHWIEINNGKIENYQAVVPTTWNCSPRDDRDQPGTCEQALQGVDVKDEENPFALVRIVRSYDPCLACSIHMVEPQGSNIGEFQIG
jgi:hydrogenase large subunit